MYVYHFWRNLGFILKWNFTGALYKITTHLQFTSFKLFMIANNTWCHLSWACSRAAMFFCLFLCPAVSSVQSRWPTKKSPNWSGTLEFVPCRHHIYQRCFMPIMLLTSMSLLLYSSVKHFGHVRWIFAKSGSSGAFLVLSPKISKADRNTFFPLSY